MRLAPAVVAPCSLLLLVLVVLLMIPADSPVPWVLTRLASTCMALIAAYKQLTYIHQHTPERSRAVAVKSDRARYDTPARRKPHASER